MARTVHEIAHSQPLKIKALRISEMRRSFEIGFLFFSIPLGKGKADFSETSEIRIRNVTLPASFTRHYDYTFAECEINLSRDDCELLAVLRFHKNAAEEFRHLEIESGVPVLKGTPETVYYCGKYTCLENIGKSVPMDIDGQ